LYNLLWAYGYNLNEVKNLCQFPRNFCVNFQGDGIVNPKLWFLTKIRVLFIGITPQLNSEEINREKPGFFLELDRSLIQKQIKE